MIQRRLTVLLLTCMLVGAAIGTFVELGGIGWDFANFYNAGLKVLSGQRAEVYDPDATIDGKLPEGTRKFLGTPLTAVFCVPLALMPRPTATVVFKLENTVAILLGLLLLYLHLRRIRAAAPDEERSFALAFVLLALVFQPFWTVYRVGGQWTPTAFLCLVLALRFHASARYAASAFWTVLAVTLKPGVVPALALLALLSERRFFVRAVMFSALFALVSLATMGWESHVQFVIKAYEVRSWRDPWFYNSSIGVPLTTLHEIIASSGEKHSGAVRLVALAGYALRVGVVVLYAGLIVRARSWAGSPEVRRNAQVLVAAVCSLMFSPVIYEHYLALMFPLFAFVAASRSQFERRANVVLGFAFALAAVQHVSLAMWLNVRFHIDDSPALMLVASLAKAAPLILTATWLWLYSGVLASGRIPFAAEIAPSRAE